jgi:hypothetical protein
VTPYRWLVLSAVIYGSIHHEGTLLSGLGETVRQTRWADWIDIATPYVVLLPVAAALHGLAADRIAWTCYLVGAITYVEGHGIHLSANSIGNVSPSPTAHLWDETVGHHLWSAGVVLVVLAIARAAHDRPAPPPAAYLLAVLVGVTFFTNAVEGSMAVFGLVAAAFLTLVGWTQRDGFGRVILAAYGIALVLLIGFGVWQGGYPEFTELGWV